MPSELESLQAAADAASPPDPKDPPVADPPVDDPPADDVTQDDDPGESDDDSPPQDPPPDPLQFTKYYDQRYGRKYAKQYRDDQEFLDALFEKDRLVGERDEDAKLAKQIRERLGESGLKALLEGQPDNGKPKPDPDMPKSVDEFLLLQEAAAQPNATQSTRDRAQKAQRAMMERLYKDPDLNGVEERLVQKLSGVIDEKLQRFSQTAEERESQKRQQDAQNQWIEKNRSKIWVDGNHQLGFSPLGKEMAEILETDPDFDPEEIPSQLRRWGLALRLAESRQPAPNQPRKPSQRAQRVPTVKTGLPKEQTVDEMFDEGKSFAEVCRLRQEAREAAEAQ